jgi:hypothetical protein
VSLPPRAGRRRARSIGGALALALLTLAPVAPARAGSFRVSQCATADAGALSPRGYQASLWSVSNGWPAVSCGSAGGAIRIGTPNWRLRHNDDTTTRFALPGSMPATTLRAAWLDWSFPHQATSVNPAYLVLTSAGARQFHAAAGTSGAGERRTLPDGARGAEFVVWCSPVNGPGWCNWPAHLLELRGLTFELEEDGEPGGGMSGPLLAAGERSGVEPVELSASTATPGSGASPCSWVACRWARSSPPKAAGTTGFRPARARCGRSSTSTLGPSPTGHSACAWSFSTRPATSA